jgi:3-(3-hydroxy-phenyl)propionate hydroxylase
MIRRHVVASDSDGAQRVDVAVVGLGPVGATVAALLAQRGRSVAVIERDRDVFPLPRAAHIDHQGLRTLQELGLLDELLPQMLENPGVEFVTADRRLLMRIRGDQGSVSGLPASMYFHQPGFDRALRARVASLPGTTTLLGTTAVDIEPGEGSVTVHLEADGRRRPPVTASWLIGCDGASSFVRSAVGIELEDLDFDGPWLVVDLVLHGDPGLPAASLNVCDPARPMTLIPIPDGRYRFELMLLPGEDPEAMSRPARVMELLAAWLPPGSASVERSAIYEFHGLLAPAWRRGRVLLAGDAAHQMPPFLGQGMCSGLRDAANLAWKLDHVLARGGPEALLDTYTSERRPHVRSIVEAAIRLGRITCTLDPELAAERHARILADPRPPTQRADFRLPSLLPGPLVLEGGGDLFVQPTLTDGRRLDDAVGQRWLVLGSDEAVLRGSRTWWQSLGALVTTVGAIGDADGKLARWLERRSADVVVVRPDRYALVANRDLDAATAAVRPLLAAARAGTPEPAGTTLRP